MVDTQETALVISKSPNRARAVEYLRKNKSDNIYIVNESKKLPAAKEMTSNIILTIESKNGNQNTFVIPNTWIPINICRFAPKDDVINSMEFIKLVNKGYLKVLSDQEAEEILSTPDAMDEEDRIHSIMEKGGIDDSTDIVQKPIAEAIPAGDDGILKDKSGVSGFVMDVLNREGIDAQQMYAIVRNQAHMLTKADWQYIKESGKSEKLVNLAMQNLVK